MPCLTDISFTARVGVTRLLGPLRHRQDDALRVLLGLETPDSGTVNGDKFRWTAVFQENRLLEGLDAEGNLRFVLGANYNAAAAQALLEELGLGDVGKKKVRDYSGGMQRRLALARALLAPSDALALDRAVHRPRRGKPRGRDARHPARGRDENRDPLHT